MDSDPLIGSTHSESGDDGGLPAADSRSRVTVDGDRECHLAMTESDHEDLQEILSPDRGPFQDWAERGAICVITQSTGDRRTTYLVNEVLQPTEEDLTITEEEDGEWTGAELEFEPQYKRAAREKAREVRGTAGLLYVHSHPPEAKRFSWGDLRHDKAQLYQETKHFGDDSVPLLAAVSPDSDDPWQVWAYDFDRAKTPAQRASDEYGPESVERTAITCVRVVGEELDKQSTADSHRVSGPAGAAGEIREDLQDSTIRVWGKDGQKAFAGLRVGVIGAGGGGSILAEMLGRLGVREVVFIDFDRLEGANSNRHLGATPQEVEQNEDKVTVCKRVAEKAAAVPDFEARAEVGSIYENVREEYDALEAALDCDVLFNAADPGTVRCTVGRLAYAHLIPVIDAGSAMPAPDGELTSKARSTVAVASPGLPCLKCSGQWSDSGFADAASPDYENDGYYDDPDEDAGKEAGDGNREVDDVAVDGEDQTVREPSSMPTNMIAMGLAGVRFLELTQGIAPDVAAGKLSLRLNSLKTIWKRADGEQLTECRDDCRQAQTALGDGAELKRGPDYKLRNVQDLDSE